MTDSFDVIMLVAWQQTNDVIMRSRLYHVISSHFLIARIRRIFLLKMYTEPVF